MSYAWQIRLKGVYFYDGLRGTILFTNCNAGKMEIRKNRRNPESVKEIVVSIYRRGTRKPGKSTAQKYRGVYRGKIHCL